MRTTQPLMWPMSAPSLLVSFIQLFGTSFCLFLTQVNLLTLSVVQALEPVVGES